jgi:hypothetical protein
MSEPIVIDEINGPDLPAEAPEQRQPVKWEFKPRKNPRWGEVTKKGLVVGRGVNQKVVDPDEVFRMAEIGCTVEEMSHFFQVDRETLKYNFWPYIKRAEVELYRKIRLKQIEVAMSGHPTMLIFLGKVLLGQNDNPGVSNNEQVLPWSSDDTKDSDQA